MSNQVIILVEPEDVNDVLIDLIEVDDIDIQLLEEGRKIAADQTKEHPAYSLAPNDLTTILITIPAIITSLTGLVKVILDYKLKTAQRKPTQKKAAQDKEPSIIVAGKTTPLSKFSTAEELKTFLEKNLK